MTIPPHSLGKLIEWKRVVELPDRRVMLSIAPHSLGKLIEWKQEGYRALATASLVYSPLVGETN